jgi:hypothetical protein
LTVCKVSTRSDKAHPMIQGSQAQPMRGCHIGSTWIHDIINPRKHTLNQSQESTWIHGPTREGNVTKITGRTCVPTKRPTWKPLKEVGPEGNRPRVNRPLIRLHPWWDPLCPTSTYLLLVGSLRQWTMCQSCKRLEQGAHLPYK